MTTMTSVDFSLFLTFGKILNFEQISLFVVVFFFVNFEQVNTCWAIHLPLCPGSPVMFHAAQ